MMRRADMLLLITCTLMPQAVDAIPADAKIDGTLSATHESVDEQRQHQQDAHSSEQDKVKALGLHGNDAPDALVKERTGGKYESCAHVAEQGHCGNELAQMGCAVSCKVAMVKSDVVHEQKREPDCPEDEDDCKCSKEEFQDCKEDCDCISNSCGFMRVNGVFEFRELQCCPTTSRTKWPEYLCNDLPENEMCKHDSQCKDGNKCFQQIDKGHCTPPWYSRMDNTCIFGHNLITYTERTQKECMELCTMYGSGCKSVEYNFGTCKLQDSSVHYGSCTASCSKPGCKTGCRNACGKKYPGYTLYIKWDPTEAVRMTPLYSEKRKNHRIRAKKIGYDGGWFVDPGLPRWVAPSPTLSYSARYNFIGNAIEEWAKKWSATVGGVKEWLDQYK